MKTFKEYMNEKLEAEDYEASVEKSKEGYRPVVLNIKTGRASYLGVPYKTEEIALKIAKGYLDIMTKTKSVKRLDDFVNSFRDDLVK
jgi:hypothetical protein